MKTAIFSQWDGRNTQSLIDFFAEYGETSEFLSCLLSYLSQQETQRVASWLLKHFCEQGGQLNQAHIEQVYSQLGNLVHWESRLHILQCIGYMPISDMVKKPLEAFLRATLIDNNKFIRAWSYNGFYLLCMQYPEYREEVEQFFIMAMRDEAASVKARIRNILKNSKH